MSLDSTDYFDDDFITFDEKLGAHLDEIKPTKNDGVILDTATQDWTLTGDLCPRCNVKMSIENLSYSCIICGLISDNRILDNNATNNQWYAVNQKEKYDSTGKSTMQGRFSDNNLVTVMDTQKKDLVKADEAGLKLNKLKNWQKRNRQNSTYDKNLIASLNIVQKLGSELKLPKPLTDSILDTYLKLCDSGFAKGKGVMNLIGAITYLLAKETNTPVVLTQILSNLSIKKKKVTKTYREIKKELLISNTASSSDSFISYFTESMKLKNCNFVKIREEYDKITEFLNEDLLRGKCPILFTTVSLFLVLKFLYLEEVTLPNYAEVVSMSPNNLKLKIKSYVSVLKSKDTNKEYKSLYFLHD